MKISKFFCMLIAGLAIIGFTTIGHASYEGKQSEDKEAIKSETIGAVESAAKPVKKSSEKSKTTARKKTSEKSKTTARKKTSEKSKTTTRKKK